MRYLVFLLYFGAVLPSYAQKLSEMDAVYLATLKAVVDYKLNDKENLETIEKLRQDKKFNEKLQKKIDSLSNEKSKSRSDKRIYDILKASGKKIYNELN